MRAMTDIETSAEIRRHIGHPVIDVDGHLQEISTFFRREVLDYAREIGGADLVDRINRSPLTFDDTMARNWFSLTEEERRDAWTPCKAWWAMPTKARDRAASYLPALLYERLDEMGIDFTVLYPSLGLSLPRLDDPELRRVACHVYNTMNAELYRPYADRMTPVAMLTANSPDEAIESLEHAVLDLGFKAVVMSRVFRPIDKVAREHPEAAAFAQRVDSFGLDSDYDYDRFWQRCVDLGVAVAMHSGEQGSGTRRSPTTYTYNHIGGFAAANEASAKSLFYAGVTARFPTLNFVFLEGGVGWACSLLNDMVAHWEKRNGSAIHGLDPAKLDLEEMQRLFERYAPDAYRENLSEVLGFFQREEHRPAELDDWRRCGIDEAKDIKPLFVDRYWFGCEADDPMNALAFDTDINAFGSRLQAVFGSDIGHWDVTDMAGVVHEAYELVERGAISETDFRDFMFANPARLYAEGNPDFFAGTRCEEAVSTLMAG
jgi:predicted TIM-barrel fold metal-dependent hydrolase